MIFDDETGEEDGAESIHVAAGIGALGVTFGLLGRHVGGGSEQALGLTS